MANNGSTIMTANDNGPAGPATVPDPASVDIRDLLKRMGKGKRPRRGANDNPPDPSFELLRAAEAGDLEKVKHWLKKKADINARRINNDTPLIVATREGHGDVVAYLLTRSTPADVTLQNNQGETALMVAVKYPDAPFEPILAHIKKTAQQALNQQDEEGATALFHAAQKGDEKKLNALADAGADINLPNGMKTTPLIQGVKFVQPTAVSSLIDRKAKLDEKDGQGATALMHAVENGNSLFSYALVYSGARIDVKNNEGKTALDMARAHGRYDLAKVMSEALARTRAERIGAYHTGLANSVKTIKPFSIKPPGGNP